MPLLIPQAGLGIHSDNMMDIPHVYYGNNFFF